MIKMKFVNKEPINKGWSCDRKYCAVTADGTKYLLRITPKEKSANRADMFCMQQKVAALNGQNVNQVQHPKRLQREIANQDIYEDEC